MRARYLQANTWLALASWTVLSLAMAALHAGEGARSPEAIWGKDIRAFEEADKTNPPPRNAVLFIGSSSIRMWSSLAQDFPGHRVINRGFGGSQLSDSVAFADRIAIPYQPKLVLLYAGDNDIAAGKSPEQVFGDFKAFVARIHAALPKTRIGYIAIKPCPAREKYLDSVKAANRLIQQYAASNDQLLFLDIFTPMLAADGRPRPDLCISDGLHCNAKGYELWASVIRPIVDKYDPPGTGGK